MITINKAKNSLLPIVCATLLKKGKYIFNNVRMIDDLKIILQLIIQFNVKYYFKKSNLIIDTTRITIPNKLHYRENTRASYYLIGSTIHYNNCSFYFGNGCDIHHESRKINYHLDLITLSGKEYTIINGMLTVTGTFTNKNVYYRFQKPSVGATINAILLFCKLKISSIFDNYAKDPYIFDVIKFIRKLGFYVYYNETYIVLNGNKTTNINKVVYHNVIPDPIETLSYIILSAITLPNNTISWYTIKNVKIKNLGESLNLLNEIGITLVRSKKQGSFFIKKNVLKPFVIETGYFPKVYTDAQPFFCILALFIGGCTITETIWDNRFNYIHEINKLGYDIKLNNNVVQVSSVKKTNIENYIFNCTDLRGGMAVYMLLKLSKKPFKMNNEHIIKRGYYNYKQNVKKIINNNFFIYTNYRVKNHSNIKIGGKSKYFCELNDVIELKYLKYFDRFKVIGTGCNIYFDKYYPGMIIKNNLTGITLIEDTTDYLKVKAMSGTLLMDLVTYCYNYSADLSKLAGIPGTIGGAVYGNVGAYNMEISNFVIECELFNNKLTDLDFEYRSSIFKKNKLNDIIISVTFCVKKGINIKESITNILEIRNKKFNYSNTLGCIFKNNKDYYAWQMIDMLNLRGKIINNIHILENHPNIFVNVGNASVNDLKKLINRIINELKDKKIIIEQEIEIIKDERFFNNSVL
uniref:UDP-N-acetylmuramate dehydrogenase n=1 Tax=viral metagenome TaxID=1070528 RepID=A0A6C0I825_9ZZZZ